MHTSTPLTGNRQRGVAKWFNLQKGFGFIAPEDGSEDVFCHQSNLLCVDGGFRSLAEKENLEFEIVDEPNQARAKRKVLAFTFSFSLPSRHLVFESLDFRFSRKKNSSKIFLI